MTPTSQAILSTQKPSAAAVLFYFPYLPPSQDLTQPGMWGMGSVYNGPDDTTERGSYTYTN